MNDADIHAFRSDAPAAVATPRRAARRWPWVLVLLGAGLLLLMLLAVAGGVSALFSLLSDVLPPDMDVFINGEPYALWELNGHDWGDSVFSALAVMAAVTVVVLTVVFLVVPAVLLAVLLSLLGGGLCVALALAAVVGSVGLVLALLLSPLWLVVLLLWLLLRKPRVSAETRTDTRTARMAT